MFVVSALGSFTPVLGLRYPALQLPPMLLQLGKHFGTGVILATGFIHMFPGAIFSLTDPCVPETVAAYSALAGLLTMLTAMAFHNIEYAVTVHADPAVPVTTISGGTLHENGEKSARHSAPVLEHANTLAVEIADSSPPLEKLHLDPAPRPEHGQHQCHGHTHTPLFHDQENDPRQITTYLLEFGIALHSIIIGVALGTAQGTEFVSLLVALCFHQFFEGLALGARIAELRYRASWMPLANALVYAVTTPIGTALGVAIRAVYQARSPTTLVVQGVLDAVSAGILIYTALVNMMAQEFAQPGFKAQPSGTKWSCWAALYLGAIAMSVVGVWA
ncbi:hypothetical protein H4R34_004253 [Dimargaris verticillata]|uniref:Zinc/iron permease n=1 Tax=Dimargaris verticillata TaxID=2761393 RepID=A0A9W8E7F2_9FUNG|nr:hypothetical protein H4R34_004253 [Dimargaris verticillata]